MLAEGLVKREDLFIQTKLVANHIHFSAHDRFTSIDGQDTAQPLPYDPSASIPDQVKQSFQRSLKNLGLNYVDSVILHGPLRTPQVGTNLTLLT